MTHSGLGRRLGYPSITVIATYVAMTFTSGHAQAAPEGQRSAPVSAERAHAALSACTEDTETSWAERVPGGWLAVCGDAWGRRVAVLDVPKVERMTRCEAKANLDYALAERITQDAGGPEDQDRMPGDSERVGAPDPDAAWEDSFAACVAE